NAADTLVWRRTGHTIIARRPVGLVIRRARPRPVARVGVLALVVGGVATRRPTRLERVHRTGRVASVTGLRNVAFAGRRTARRTIGFYGVSGTARAGPVASLCNIARTVGGATDRSGISGGVQAENAGAVALIESARVTVAGTRRTARFFGVCR